MDNSVLKLEAGMAGCPERSNHLFTISYSTVSSVEGSGSVIMLAMLFSLVPALPIFRHKSMTS